MSQLHSNYPKEVIEGMLKNQFSNFLFDARYIIALDRCVAAGEWYMYRECRTGLVVSTQSTKGTTRPYPVLSKTNVFMASTRRQFLLKQYKTLNPSFNVGNKMQNKTNANTRLRNQTLYLMDGITTISVVFTESESDQYTYLALLSDDVKPGDYVLVHDINGELGKSAKTARVFHVDDIPMIDEEAPFNYKFIIGKYDSTRYDRINEKVNAAVEQFTKARSIAKRESYRNAIIAQAGGDSNMLTLSIE